MYHIYVGPDIATSLAADGSLDVVLSQSGALKRLVDEFVQGHPKLDILGEVRLDRLFMPENVCVEATYSSTGNA